MAQRTLPAGVQVFHKLRTQRMQEVRLGTTLSDPSVDSDGVLAGVQNEAEFSVDFDPANEKYDFFYRSINENKVGPVISIKRKDIRSTLSGAINASATAFIIVAPINTDSFKVGDPIEIENELMVLLTWNSTTGDATVEERGAHGTTATSHADGISVAKMFYTVPHNSIVLAGNLDNVLPLAPTSFVLTNVVGAIGNGISMTIELPASQIKSLFRIHIQTSTVLWPEDFENLTGLIGTQASGSDGAIVQGGSSLTTSVTLDTGWAGKLIHTHESINLSTGEVSAPDILRIDTVVDNGDGTWTVNVIGDNVFNLRRGVIGTAGVVNWVIVDASRSPGTPSTWVEQVKPFFNQGAGLGDPDVLIINHILFTAETVFTRCRLRSFEGYGPWMYHNGSTGTTTRANATTFTPSHLQGPGIDPNAIDETHIQDNSITARKLTENAMNFNTDIVFSAVDNDTVQWTSGTIEFADGTTFSIVSGNTGNISSLNFIYFDPTISSTILQLTTSRAVAVGDRKQIISIVEDGPVGENAFFVPVIGVLGLNSTGIGPNAIKEINITIDAVTETKIANDSITTPKLQANSVTSNEILANTITADEIAANTITASEILANTITAAEIKANTITAAEIKALTITAGQISANTITAAQINTATITTLDLTAGTITGVTITGGIVRTAASGERVEMVAATPNRVAWTNTSGIVKYIETFLTQSNTMFLQHGDGTSTSGVRISVLVGGSGGADFLFTSTGLDCLGESIRNIGDLECDSITKDGAGSIAINSNMDMGGRGLFSCNEVSPNADDTGLCGSVTKTWLEGHFKRIALNGVKYLFPSADGSSGQQLQTDGSLNLSWAAAGSLKEWKHIQGKPLSPDDSLEKLKDIPVYPFKFKKGYGTGDLENIYSGVMADDLPEVMHHNNTIFSSLSGFGQLLLYVQALHKRIRELEIKRRC